MGFRVGRGGLQRNAKLCLYVEGRVHFKFRSIQGEYVNFCCPPALKNQNYSYQNVSETTVVFFLSKMEPDNIHGFSCVREVLVSKYVITEK